MGSFHSGFGGHKSYLGHCEDGIIYSGSGNSTPIGRYENGNIYNQFKEYVGSYSGGSIYNSSRTHIASYDGGIVYNKYLNAVVGREQVGSYDSNPAEAAALVLLFLGETAVNGGNSSSTKDSTTTNTTTYSSNGSTDSGCLSAIFALLWGIISFVFVVIIPFLFIYYIIPCCLGLSWIGIFLLMALIPSAGAIPLLFVCGFALALLLSDFFPYYIIAVIIKIKTKCSKKEFLKLFWTWFLKGPVAYVDLHEFLKETNIMPKTTNILGKRIKRMEKIFKKKEKN